MPVRDAPPTSDAALRDRLLAAAESQLAGAPDHDIATRAVCDAAGVSQPVLYRLFGDKQGLLAAVVDSGFDRYVRDKIAQAVTDDPVADLRAGWQQHMEFARDNPAVYRLMFSPNAIGEPTARKRIFDLLVEALQRVATVGRLAVPAPIAAQVILSGNVGVALNQLMQPELYSDTELSTRMRDAVFASVLTEHSDSDSVATPHLAPAALQLAALVQREQPAVLAAEEVALLLRWLATLSQ